MAGFRVSIPNSVRKTIQNIKEIAGNHSDEEIYAMLKDCSMDPNETAQKLLLQDTFHEVKRKRDRRKENNREPADSRWRPGVQGRGGRGGRGNYSSRHISHDAIGGRSISVGKENEDNKGLDRGTTSSLSPITQDSENKFTTPASSSFAGVANGPTKLEHPISAQGCATQVSGVSEGSSAAESNGIGITPPASIDVKRGSPSEIGGSCGQPVSTFDQFLPSMIPASVSGAYASDSDPVLLPSLDSRIPGVVGTIKREVGGLRVASETTTRTIVSPGATGSELPSRSVKGSSEVSNSYIQGKMPSKPHGVEVNQLLDTSQAVPSSSHTGSSSSRPSSNYSNRSQQPSGSQKAGPSKEWKPKATNVNPAQASGMLGTPDVVPITAETTDPPLPALSSMASEENTSKLQKKLDELQFSDTQHVIIPNHLQVPESERTRLSFGSFDASFGVGTSFVKGPDSNKSSSPLSESSQESEDNAEELSSSIQNASPTAEDSEYPDHPQSPIQMPENLSSKEADIFSSISAVREYDQPKPEAALAQEGPQYSVVHTTPTYSTFGIPQMLGGQFAPFESVEPQARDSSRPSSFVVQQPFDPSANYFTQIYRPTSDGDGRFSPFPTPGAATKYNGHIAVIPAQSGQSPPEGGNSLVLSTTGPTPLVTQAAGVMQSSVAVNQQAVPVFRQPGGLQLPPYHPNYMPYSQYFPQFYVPPPAIHHFLSNATFPQQPPTGSIYPPPAAAAAATAVKYPISQYKPGTNTGSSTHVGMPTGYGTYSTTLAGYSPSAVVTSGNLTGNEDLTASHYKENNAYITGQQTEGSAVWFSTPGRDISGLQASSFYNLSPQGQPMTFTPMQAGHGSFPGIYHPTQAVPAATVHPLLQQPQTMAGAVEMAGPPAGVYQQPQRGQINWPNNY